MSNIAQKQLRYFSVDTIADLKSNLSAFAGDISLVLANKTLYQFVIYDQGDVVPVDDGINVLELTNEDPLCRWVAIDSYSSRVVTDTFSATDNRWAHDAARNVYEMTVSTVNGVASCVCHLYNSNGEEVFPQKITFYKSSGMITGVVIEVSDTPDCRFEGSYYIIKDKLV